jgi:hypothetical protein
MATPAGREKYYFREIFHHRWNFYYRPMAVKIHTIVEYPPGMKASTIPSSFTGIVQSMTQSRIRSAS